jgi:hypothetical protein
MISIPNSTINTVSIKIVTGITTRLRKNGNNMRNPIANSTPIKILDKYWATLRGIPIGSN